MLWNRLGDGRWKKERRLNTCILMHGRVGFQLLRFIITDQVINILHRFNENHSTITEGTKGRVYLTAVNINSILKNWDKSYHYFKN